MIKTIKIDNQDVTFLSNGATPWYYRQYFQRDFLADIYAFHKRVKSDDEVSEADFSMFEFIAYTMARQGAKAKGLEFPETLLEWLETFENPFAIYQHTFEILDVWFSNEKTLSKSKKK